MWLNFTINVKIQGLFLKSRLAGINKNRKILWIIHFFHKFIKHYDTNYHFVFLLFSCYAHAL